MQATEGIGVEGVLKMITIYSNYVVCTTQQEAVGIQEIIANSSECTPEICDYRNMFLVEHEFGREKMVQLLEEYISSERNLEGGLTCK